MKHLLYKKENEIATLTINRPEVMNALSHDLLEEMLEFLEGQAVDEKIKVLILTGAGDKAFASGADVQEMLQMDAEEMRAYCSLGMNVASALSFAHYVTIAAVNGYALGGGLEVALGCDFIYASDQAKLGLPEVTLGLIPGFGGVTRLVQVAGLPRAKEMIITGKALKASEAYDWGIVNRVCGASNLMEECRKTAKRILDNEWFAVNQAKWAIDEGLELTLDESLELEKNVCMECHQTEECKERMKRFVEK